MKKILCCVAVILALMSFVAWLNPDTVDIYTGTITQEGTSYSVSDLSGSIEFILDSYVGLALTESGDLYNTTNAVINGVALIGGSEYDIRLSSLGGLQIYQSYTSSGYERWTWVDYTLDAGAVPGSLESAELVYYGILFVLVLILIISVLRLFL